MDRALDLLKIREQTDGLQRSGTLLRESFVGSLKEPDGQIEPDLTISQEIILPVKKEKKNKAVGLVRAEDIECLNFRFTTDSLTEEESLLHMFLLTCGREGCEELVCDRGTFRAANPSCRKNLDESDMFMHFIDFLTPVNSPRLKCLEKGTMGAKLFRVKSSVKHIREDFRSNDILVCENHLRKKATRGIKESGKGTGVNISLKLQNVRNLPNKVSRSKDSANLWGSFS